MAEGNNNEKVSGEVTPREYQLELLESAIKENIIVCLGTGTGKTFISIKLIEHLARKDDIFRPFSDGAKRTFFLVNSVPLVFQQAEAIEKHTALKVKSFCGEMGVDFWDKTEWLQHFKKNHVLVMTHQIYLDLLQHAKLRLEQANLLVFDECHHARKNHPFKKIMDLFADFPENHPRVLGLTASVVSKKIKPHKIPSEVKTLENTMRCVCKTASDPNVVEKYGAKPKEDMVTYPSSKHTGSVAKYLEDAFRPVLDSLHNFLKDVKVSLGLDSVEDDIAKELVVLKGMVRECTAALDEIGVWAAYEVSKMLIVDLEKRPARRRVMLPGVTRWICLLIEATLTSLREVCAIYGEFQLANQTKGLIQQEYLKPKVKTLMELYQNGDPNICSIVFVERRYAACVVSKLFNELAAADQGFHHLSSNFVTGHGADISRTSQTEMKFNEQKTILQEFRQGKFNVLVGTSVVEEGVDIPKCNLVVMFDFPKNYRAFVQSRGRGRAKDAKYVMLVKKSEREEKREEQMMYHGVDHYLTELCKRNRAAPTDEEADEAVTVHPLAPYYTLQKARLDMANSISRLYRYCSKLPCDRFTTLKPQFTTHDVGEKFQCTLQMPRNSAITAVLQGEPMPGKKEAKMAVAFKACTQLHEAGALNDNLLPYISSSGSDSEDVDETDGSKPKAGTKKRVRRHKVKVARQLEGELRADGGQTLYVYAIKMKVVDVFPGKKSKTKKKMWDRKKPVFGIVTNIPLPRLPDFPLYNDFGKVDVALEHCLTLDNLTPQQLDLINWFHEFIFSEALCFGGYFTGAGCRVVLLSFTDSSYQAVSTKRPYSPTEVTAIDFEEMEKIRKIEGGRISSDTDLHDAVVVVPYKSKASGQSSDADNVHQYPRYLIYKVEQNLSPRSEFPNPLKARTYKEYFWSEHGIRIKDDSQPLVRVVHFSRKVSIDCRFREPITSKSEWVEHMMPEILRLKKCPLSVLLRATLLPSVLYRIQSLLAMLELQNIISTVERIDIIPETPVVVNRPVECGEDPEELPSKRFCPSPLEPIFSGADDDEVDAPDLSFLSALERYFCPSERSRRVSLFGLLEAVTCASSADAFNLERLEMLGDSFLKMAVSIYVYMQYENHKDEGKLTKYRKRQVSNKNLFNLAMKKGLPGYIKYRVLDRTTWVPPGFTTLPKSCQNGEDVMWNGDEKPPCGERRLPGSREGVVTQAIPDKSIADSVEALVGAHLTQCGYLDTLRFMTWLGLDVLAKNEGETSFRPAAKYANFSVPSFDIPPGEDRQRYQEVLKQQTTELASFEDKIGYVFQNKVLLLEAFTHPTYSDNTITGSYQRLEFLGDAILDFLVTQHIYDKCDESLTPGKLTHLRSALVNNNIFATIAVENDYQKYLKEYSPQLFTNIKSFVEGVKEFQEESGNKVTPDPFVMAVTDDECGVDLIEAPKPLGDVFESVAGAIFVDSGLDVKTVWKVCYPMLKKFIDAYSKKVPIHPVTAVTEFDSGADFTFDTATEGKTSCKLTLTSDEAKKLPHQQFKGVGRNKHNAKLSASYKAWNEIREKDLNS